MRWTAMVFLAFITHILLDGLTVYGTQILWPLPTPPVMWSTIFIIDPAYSVPLFTGVLAALFLSRQRGRGHMVNTVCLALSTLYLVWSIGAKWHVNDTARESLDTQKIAYQKLLTVPAPFNTLLWRVLVMDKTGYYEGFYSFLDKDRTIRFKYYPSDNRLLDDLADHWPVKRLRWFTHGFYSVQDRERAIVISDLRMGLEPNYVFQFKVGRIDNPHVRPTKSARVVAERGLERLPWVWKRIWDPVE
jgi:inner membrane protein